MRTEAKVCMKKGGTTGSGRERKEKARVGGYGKKHSQHTIYACIKMSLHNNYIFNEYI